MALQRDERRMLLEPFGLSDLIGEPSAPPSDLGPEVVISRDDETWAPYFVTVTVRDVEHLKCLTGVPSSVAAAATATSDYDVPRNASGTTAPAPEGDESTIVSRSISALFGDWEGDLGQQESADEVRDFMLEAAGELPLFAATDLVVKNGEVYTLRSAPTFYFDSITVYGTGEIVTEGQIKIICESITYVPA